jgi:methylenetetrahydrofolate dehydrogenase (NADP+)/methenyltetrahydrofolate cyclohydrolase
LNEALRRHDELEVPSRGEQQSSRAAEQQSIKRPYHQYGANHHTTLPDKTMQLKNTFPALISSLFIRPAAFHSCSRYFSLSHSNGATILMDGRSLAAEIQLDLAKVTAILGKNMVQSGQIRPGLAVLSVGSSDRASNRYVQRKQAVAQQLGYFSLLKSYEESVTTEEIVQEIQKLNADDRIHGILVQFPLPEALNELKIVETIATTKDVDAFHPNNMGILALQQQIVQNNALTDRFYGKEQYFLPNTRYIKHFWQDFYQNNIPCTAKACLRLLNHYDIPVAGQNVVVIGCSSTVGLPLGLLLLHKRASVVFLHEFSKISDITGHCMAADIIIVAVGKPNYLQSSWIKPGAAVLDVGINFISAKSEELSQATGQIEQNPLDSAQNLILVGDCAVNCKESGTLSYLSPVPGGIGPLTVSMLMENTLLNWLLANFLNFSPENWLNNLSNDNSRVGQMREEALEQRMIALECVHLIAKLQINAAEGKEAAEGMHRVLERAQLLHSEIGRYLGKPGQEVQAKGKE